MKNLLPRLQIYYWDFIFVITGPLGSVPSHSHNAIHVLINPRGDLKVRIGDSVLTDPVVFIDKNIQHEIIKSDARQVNILIDGDSDIAKHLSHQFLKGDRFSTDQQLLNDVQFENPTEMKKQFYDLLNREGCTVCAPNDTRILKIKTLIDQDEEKKLSLKWLAEQVFLSESRLAHLFKEETGIPIRKYMLWRRLLSAIRIILDGHNLTQAAHYSGFSDSAHLSRTFKANFGFNLSKIFKNSKFIQFHSL